MIINQTQAALEFVQNRQQQVRSLEVSLIEMAMHLLDTADIKVLSASELELARSMCRDGHLKEIFTLLRSHAACFAVSGDSRVYWYWIDGAGFLFDAVGTHWQYMTTERRSISLEWAWKSVQSAQEV